METTCLMSKAISSASNTRKKFSSLSLSYRTLKMARQERATDKVLKNSKFLTLYFF